MNKILWIQTGLFIFDVKQVSFCKKYSAIQQIYSFFGLVIFAWDGKVSDQYMKIEMAQPKVVIYNYL